MSVAQGRIPQLDGIRGIAILAVLFFHLTFFGPLPELARRDTAFKPLFVALMGGWAGVDLFFVLSGFLITRLLLQARGAPGYFRNFYVRRVLRIFPAYYFALAVYFLLPLPTSLRLDRVDLGSAPWLFAYVSNWRIAQGGWDSITLSLQHFWSLAIEEQFYLVWPLLIWALNRKRALWLCALMIVGSLALRVALVSAGQPVAAYALTPARLDGLGAGGLLALLHERGQVPNARLRLAGYVLGGLGVAFVVAKTGLFYFEERHWAPSIGILIVCLLGFTFLSSALSDDRTSLLSRILESRLLGLFGAYSYGLYVWHQPVIVLMRRHGFLDMLTDRGLHAVPLLFVWYAGGVFFTLAAALFSYHAIEHTFLSWKDRFAPAPASVDGLAGSGASGVRNG